MKSFRVDAAVLHSLKAKTKEDVRKFENVFPWIVSDLNEDFSDVPEGAKWFSQVLDYNVPDGKKSKGLSVPLFYKALEDPNGLTPASTKLSNILGWCLELNRTALLIQDDILEAAETRRNKPCWYKLDNVGVDAANDSVLVKHGVFRILKQYFSRDPFYVEYVELFHEIAWKFAVARALDVITVKEGKSNINTYTPDKYETVLKCKAESNSLLFPVTLAMYLSKKHDPVVCAKVKPVLEELDRLLQVNDDFIDVYGDPNGVGKDLKNGSCTWLICQALERANPIQKSALQANYGKAHPKAIQTVKEIYDELNMKGAYEDYERKKLESIQNQIGRISRGFPYKLLLEFLKNLIAHKNWREDESLLLYSIEMYANYLL